MKSSARTSFTILNGHRPSRRLKHLMRYRTKRTDIGLILFWLPISTCTSAPRPLWPHGSWNPSLRPNHLQKFSSDETFSHRPCLFDDSPGFSEKQGGGPLAFGAISRFFPFGRTGDRHFELFVVLVRFFLSSVEAQYFCSAGRAAYSHGRTSRGRPERFLRRIFQRQSQPR